MPAQPRTPAQWNSAPTRTVRARDLAAGNVLVNGSASTAFPAALITAVRRVTDNGRDYVMLTARLITDDPDLDTTPFEFTEPTGAIRLIAVPTWAA